MVQSVTLEQALQNPTGSPEALARYQDNPYLDIINQILHAYIARVNQDFPSIATTANVNVFDKPDNHLDPLDFNGHASTSTSGEFCLPQACTSILGVEVCMPPVKICLGGSAEAGLNTLHGLSSLQITSINVTDASTPAGGKSTIQATLSLTASSVTADGYAKASGGPSGFSVPVSTSASGGFNNVAVSTTASAVVDVDNKKLDSITLNTFNLSYSSIDISIGALGPFNSLLSPLVNLLRNVVSSFWNMDGAISGALKGVLQNALNSNL